MKLEKQVLVYTYDTVADRSGPINSCPTVEVAVRSVEKFCKTNEGIQYGDIELYHLASVDSLGNFEIVDDSLPVWQYLESENVKV